MFVSMPMVFVFGVKGAGHVQSGSDTHLLQGQDSDVCFGNR